MYLTKAANLVELQLSLPSRVDGRKETTLIFIRNKARAEPGSGWACLSWSGFERTGEPQINKKIQVEAWFLCQEK